MYFKIGDIKNILKEIINITALKILESFNLVLSNSYSIPFNLRKYIIICTIIKM